MFEWHKADISEVALEFGTDIKIGRTNMDSKRRRKSKNNIFRIASVDSGSIIRQIASDASLILLAVTYLIAALLGFHIEALFALPVLLTAFSVACYIRYRSEKLIFAAHSLLLPKAKIIENGNKIRLSVLDVEVGDLIYFGKGDIIPADARLVSSDNLDIAERFYNKLTGKVEFKCLKKNHELLYSDNNTSEIYDNMVYAGSTVVSGQGRAIVTAIGLGTRVGKVEDCISLVPQIDTPSYLNTFSKFTKIFSLSVLLSLVPISLILIYLNTLNNSEGASNGILYTFLTMLAISVTSMSELISAPSSAIVSHTLFAHKRNIDNGITKLSSAERIAEADTVLILCPDILTDKRQFVRRVFLSDKEYRFDSLRSNELDSFTSAIAIYLSGRHNNADIYEKKALKRFVSKKNANSRIGSIVSYPAFFKVDDIDKVKSCKYFRTEGGSQWRFNDETLQRLVDFYYKYLDLGLKVYLYISIDDENKQHVFEGMIAIGEEYPFSNGEFLSDCFENDITPVLVLETENEASVKFALNCGIVNKADDIVCASKLTQAGSLLSEVSTNSPVYIGFGRSGTKEILNHLTQNSKVVLPVIKGLSDKSAIFPLTVYATHSESSLDSVKYTSSLSLKPADAEQHSGGIADAVNSIKASRLTRLKLNIFKRYLTFSTAFRISLVMITLLTASSIKPMSALMILLSGLLADGTALFATATAKGIPNSTKKRFKDIPYIVFAIAGFCIAFISYITTKILIHTGTITVGNSQIFDFYASLITQLLSLAAFLLMIRNRTCKFKFNFAYVSVLAVLCTYLVLQNWFSDSIYAQLNSLSYSRIDFCTLPFLLLSGIISLVLLVLIDKLFAYYKK